MLRLLSRRTAGREVTLTEYHQHLVELNALVVACAKARDAKSCDPALVGQDDHVPLGNAPNAERRLVRYNWLRGLLLKAQGKGRDRRKRLKTRAGIKTKLIILGVCVGLVWGLLQLERAGAPGWCRRATVSRRRSRLGPRLATVAGRRAPRRRRRPVARGDSLRLLGRDLAPRIPAAVAGRPRPHSARVPGAGRPGRPAQAAGLATLTGSFERIWYGGRPAAESDYRARPSNWRPR
jgi:hypothetical protein